MEGLRQVRTYQNDHWAAVTKNRMAREHDNENDRLADWCRVCEVCGEHIPPYVDHRHEKRNDE